MRYIPISKTDAKLILYKMLYDSGIDRKYIENSPAELIHQKSIPYYPDWKITIKDIIFYVHQDGTITN